MIKVTVGSNTERKDVFVDENTTTPKSVFTDNGIGFNNPGAINYMDGCPMTPEMMNSTFKELGIRETTALMSIMKLTNN